MHAPVCQREQEPKSPFVFVSERGDPFSNRGFQATVERAGKAAGFGMKIHPHMLRHACGYTVVALVIHWMADPVPGLGMRCRCSCQPWSQLLSRFYCRARMPRRWPISPTALAP